MQKIVKIEGKEHTIQIGDYIVAGDEYGRCRTGGNWLISINGQDLHPTAPQDEMLKVGDRIEVKTLSSRTGLETTVQARVTNILLREQPKGKHGTTVTEINLADLDSCIIDFFDGDFSRWAYGRNVEKLAQ